MILIHIRVQMRIIKGKFSNLVVLTKLLIPIRKYLQQCYSLQDEFSQNTINKLRVLSKLHPSVCVCVCVCVNK
jgi:hypothetical protein